MARNSWTSLSVRPDAVVLHGECCGAVVRRLDQLEADLALVRRVDLPPGGDRVDGVLEQFADEDARAAIKVIGK